jgi:hypothetical protein
MQMFCTFKFSFGGDVLAFFWFGDCFGYFFQNLGDFFPNLLVTLILTRVANNMLG